MVGHTVLIRNYGSNDPWAPPESAEYKDENHLEELLAMQPERIPNVQPGSVALRQLSTSHGPIDLCVLTPTGRLTVVECKLQRSSEHRRRVVGQVIDYAASIHADGFKSFEQSWMSKTSGTLDDVLESDGRANLERNIQEGSIDLCLVVDHIDAELRRMVEYLNNFTRDDVSVTALELSYARHGSVELLIPTSYGLEIAQTKSGVRARSQESWTWESFVESLESGEDKEIALDLYRRLLEVKKSGPLDQLLCGIRPGGSIYFQLTGRKYAPFCLWQNSARRLQVFGTWRMWKARLNDIRYEELAKLLGQSHLGGSKGVNATSLDLDAFWKVALDCDHLLNQPD